MMAELKTLAARIRGALTLGRIDRDFQQELKSHLENMTEENIRRGMTPEEAARQARLRLGGVEQLREANREQRGLPLIAAFVGDLRYAFRCLRRAPGFATIAILTLALGIGANTAIFSIVNSILLRPLPVPAADQITVLAYEHKGGDLLAWFSYPNYRDIRDQSTSVFSDLAAYHNGFDGLSTNDRADRIFDNYVTGNFFTMLGIRPALGRLIAPSEGDVHVTNPVIVLSYAFWQTRFGGAADIVGRKVLVDGRPVTVIGVTPRNFHGVFSMTETQAYLPMSMSAEDPSHFANRALGNLQVLGRLKPGAEIGQAQSVLAVIAQRLSADHPKTDADLSISAYPERLARPFPSLHNPILGIATLFLALAALVLILACVNVVNLLLVRSATRRREMAVRAALGGSRSRLMRQLLTESLFLALVGGLGGILLGRAACLGLESMSFSGGFQMLLDLHFDWRVFLYAFVIAMVAGGVVGLLPALRAARVAPAAVLHEGGRSATPGRQRLRTALVVAQVAGSLMLLVVAGLFTRSLNRAQQVKLGFEPSHVLNMSMDPREIGYNPAQGRQFYRLLVERARNLPGVRSASLAYTVPMRYYTVNSVSLEIDGYTPPPGKPKPNVSFNNVSPGYFETLRIPLLQGRTFTDGDDAKTAPVAIINDAMAKRFWPHENAIGRKFRLATNPQRELEVIGVVGDSKMADISERPTPYFFLPLSQNYLSYETLQLRTAGPPSAMISQTRSLIASLAPGLPVFDVGTMNEALSSSAFLLFRYGAILAAALGLLGLTLALIGVYGVASYAVSQRTSEIGIRFALGAQPLQVLSMVLRQGVWIVAVGVGLGVVGALAAARVVGSFLVVSATDPVTYLAVSLLLTLVVLVACWIPARRAMRVDPMVALRHE